MRETVKDKGRIEHMLAAIANVEEFTNGVSCKQQGIVLCRSQEYRDSGRSYIYADQGVQGFSSVYTLAGHREDAPCIGARLLHDISRESVGNGAGGLTRIEEKARRFIGRNVKSHAKALFSTSD